MKSYHYEFTPCEGEHLIARPLGRFAVPIVQLSCQSFVIPDDPAIRRIEFLTAHVYARGLGRALCLAGIPVFDLRGKVRVYCPRSSARLIVAAFDGIGSLAPSRNRLHKCAERGDVGAIAKIVGTVRYALEDDAVVIEGKRRYPLPKDAILL